MTVSGSPNLHGIVAERREAVGVSQPDLAWLSRVSRNTVSNFERGRGVSQNTIRNVVRALGGDFWKALHWDANLKEPQDDLAYDYLPPDPDALWTLPEEQVRGVLRFIVKLRLENPRVARRVADNWLTYNTALSDLSSSTGVDAERAAHEREDAFKELRRDIFYLLGEDGDADIEAWFADEGWTPEDELPEPHWVEQEEQIRQEVERFQRPPEAPKFVINKEGIDALVEQLQAQLNRIEVKQDAVGTIHEKADAFSKLPLLVQRELMHGDVGNAAIDNPPGADGVTHVLLTLTREGSPGFDQRKALESLSNALCANRIALSLMYGFDRAEPSLDKVVSIVRTAMDTYGIGKRSDGWELDTELYPRKEGP